MDVPEDLIALRRRFDAAVDVAKEVAASLPSGADIAEGLAEITDGQREALGAARAECLRLALELGGHPWWSELTGEERSEGRKALWKAIAA